MTYIEQVLEIDLGQFDADGRAARVKIVVHHTHCDAQLRANVGACLKNNK